MRQSNKKPIKWHQECLFNQKQYLINKQKELNKLIEEVNKTQAQVNFSQLQINQAIEKGLTEFDRDRYLVDKPIVSS